MDNLQGGPLEPENRYNQHPGHHPKNHEGVINLKGAKCPKK